MTIAYFAPIPFRFLKQRPQFLAEELSKKHDVYYVEPTIPLLRKLIKGGELWYGKNEDITASLHIIRANGFFTGHRMFDRIDFLRLNSLAERIQIEKRIPKPDVFWIGYVGWYPVVSHFSGCLIYDKMDENSLLASNEFLQDHLATIEKSLLKRANIIFTTAKLLYENAKKVNENVFLVPNAVVKNRVPVKLSSDSNTDKRVYGYVGMIDHWFDLDTVRIIVEADRNNYIELVGPNNIPEFVHPRVKYTGLVESDRVMSMIDNFDVCLYPFKNSALLDTINPVKIYEYLSMNKPIIAVDSKETRQFGNRLHLYSNEETLYQLVQTALPRPFISDIDRVHFVGENCWEKRGNDILRIIERE